MSTTRKIFWGILALSYTVLVVQLHSAYVYVHAYFVQGSSAQVHKPSVHSTNVHAVRGEATIGDFGTVAVFFLFIFGILYLYLWKKQRDKRKNDSRDATQRRLKRQEEEHVPNESEAEILENWPNEAGQYSAIDCARLIMDTPKYKKLHELILKTNSNYWNYHEFMNVKKVSSDHVKGKILNLTKVWTRNPDNDKELPRISFLKKKQKV